MALANEWHAQHLREIGIRGNLGKALRSSESLMEKWEGLSITNFRYENSDLVWNIRQLCTIQELINEGRKMKHCVASYAHKCSNMYCGIFNVSRFFKSVDVTESVATIQVSSQYEIVQIRGKCNSIVNGKALGIIKRWAQQNRLKHNSYLLID